MKKFTKVYKAPGYPIDPARQAARNLDAWVNTIALVTTEGAFQMPDRFATDWSRLRHLFCESAN